MPLQKSVVSMPFTKGVDTKTDAKLSAKPSRLENAVFRGGTIAKPYGSVALTTTIDTGGNQTKGEALFAFDNELVRINGGTTYGLGNDGGPSATPSWVTKPGGAHYATIARTRIQRNPRTQTGFDQATTTVNLFGGGTLTVTLFAWLELSGPQQGLHIALMDEVSGTFYQTGATALASTTNASFLRCLVGGNGFLVLWLDGANLKSANIALSSPEAAPTIHTLANNVSTSLGESGGTYSLGFAGFDATSAGGGTVAYVNNTSANNDSVTLLNINADGTAGTSRILSAMTDTDGSSKVNAIGGFALATADFGAHLYLVYSDSNIAGSSISACYYMVFNAGTLATVLAKTTISNSTTFAAAALTDGVNGNLTAVFLSTTVNPTGAFAYAVLGTGGVVTSYSTIPGTSGLTLASDAVAWDGGVVFAACSIARGGATASLQPTAFIVDTKGNTVARCLPGEADAATSTRLARVSTFNGNPHFLFSERGRLAYSSVAGHTTDVTPKGITRIALNSTNAGLLPINRVGETVYIGGACPRIYDGAQVVEEGFPQYPEGLSLSFGGSGGNLTAGAQYQYKAVYSWLDARGQLHRSAAGTAVTGTPTSGQVATVTVPCLPLSSKDLLPQGASVQIELYRTEGNGTNFYRVSSVNAPTYNSTTALTVTLPTDGLSDANLISGEWLYTTGGIFDWYAPPAYSAACEHKGRLIICGLEDVYAWQSSSQAIQGESLRFNPAWGGRVPASTGPLVACASMDGNLFLFTTSACYLVQGDGPDLLGNNPWPPPQLVVSVDSGPQGPASVVVAPDGIWFQSQKGLARLDRHLGFEYAGAEVEAYGQWTFRNAIVRPEVEQLWWHADTGNDATFGSAAAIVWDYHYNQWSVLTGNNSTTFGAQDACYYQGKYTRINAAGVVLQEASNTYLQNGTAISTVVETEWLKLASVQGFQRIWRALVLGAYGSDFTLTWDAAYNYNTTYAPADTLTLVGNSVFTVGGAFQLRRLLRQQKCEAVKFRFTDSAIGGNGQGMGLTDLTLTFGVRQGAWKLPPSQSIG